MAKLLVIADDLTGALDTGVQFSKRGIRTLVSTKLDMDFESVDEGVEVLVIDTESRHIDMHEAWKRVYSVTAKAVQSGMEMIYKKTDSTLRGNIGSELKALLDGSGEKQMAFIPAYPGMGRTTINACQYVDGVPVSESMFARDPLNPVTDSYIPDIIHKQSDINVSIASIDSIENENIFRIAEDRNIIVFDAACDEHLLIIGRLLKDNGRLRIVAGCAGFASVLPQIVDFSISEKKVEIAQKGMLVINGSMNDASFRQVKYAEINGMVSAELPPEIILAPGPLQSIQADEFVEKVVLMISMGKRVIIKTASSYEDAQRYIEYGSRIGLDKNDIHLRIAANTGFIVKRIIDKINIGNLVVFGGDTLIGITGALCCDGMEIMDEIETGVPCSRLVWTGNDMNVITKAGGFGSEDLLLKIEKYIDRRSGI